MIDIDANDAEIRKRYKEVRRFVPNRSLLHSSLRSAFPEALVDCVLEGEKKVYTRDPYTTNISVIVVVARGSIQTSEELALGGG